MSRNSWIPFEEIALWDRLLAAAGGHPLQSVLWGNARHRIDGIPQLLLAYRSNEGTVNGLARVEMRKTPFAATVAWIPKGPVWGDNEVRGAAVSLRAELKRRGLIACISDPYAVSSTPKAEQPKTIWLDLTLGLDALFNALDSQWRYGARRALREGVVVRTSKAAVDVSAFFRLCRTLSMNKGFALPGSEALMQDLIGSSSPDGPVGMTLYIGVVDGVIAGGALVARCGRHLHYFWGASDRRFSKYRVSEAVQWKVIQDGVNSGMIRYDLEGIDPEGNPGVYEFKRKMGGSEVTLQGMEAIPLSWGGHVVVGLGRGLRRL